MGTQSADRKGERHSKISTLHLGGWLNITHLSVHMDLNWCLQIITKRWVENLEKQVSYLVGLIEHTDRTCKASKCKYYFFLFYNIAYTEMCLLAASRITLLAQEGSY